MQHTAHKAHGHTGTRGTEQTRSSHARDEAPQRSDATIKRNNKAYADKAKALRRKAQRHNWPCWICGQPIDWQAPAGTKQSYTYDHIQAVANGGKIRGEGRPAHHSCNSRRGNTRTVTAEHSPLNW